MLKTLAVALLISSAFSCFIFSPKCAPVKPAPIKCPPAPVKPAPVPVKCPPAPVKPTPTPVPVKCPPVVPIKCETGIDLPDLPRTPDQFCINEPHYGVPIIRDPIINIPCAPNAPVIGHPGKPNIPVICDIKVPTAPCKPTLPSLPCKDKSCGCW